MPFLEETAASQRPRDLASLGNLLPFYWCLVDGFAECGFSNPVLDSLEREQNKILSRPHWCPHQCDYPGDFYNRSDN